MKLASFHTGLHLTLNGVPYRIDRILDGENCYLERLSDKSLETKTKKQLAELLAAGQLNLTAGTEETQKRVKDNRSSKDMSALPETEQQKIFRRLEYVQEACRLLGNNPTKTGISDVVDRVKDRLGDTAPPAGYTVYRWWKRWESSQKDLMALADRKMGVTGTRKFRGVVEEELSRLIEEVYLTAQRPTKKVIYDLFLYRLHELNRARQRPLGIPSKAQFYRMFSALDKYEEMAAREGKHVADKHFRASGLGARTKYILERVEVDHTPIDLMVINDKTGLVDGRPTLTVLLDHHSRLPLGFEVGFEPPSELSVMRALRNSILPKGYVKELFPDFANSWPAYGIPNTLICDNGLEFHAKQLRRMCAELNVELQFCPKKQPHYKGAVERFLGTLNRAVCHRIPGSTFSNITQRGEYKSVENAIITLSELNEFIHHWIIDIYAQEIHSVTNRTPSALWSEGLSLVEPLLPESLDQLDLILTREVKRKLRHQGIELFGLYYNSPTLATLRTRTSDTLEVSVRYNPENLESLWVYDEFNGDFIQTPAIDTEYTKGLTLRQHRQIRKDAKSRGAKDQDSDLLLESKARFHQKLEDLSRNRLLRDRKKAARDAPVIPFEIPPTKKSPQVTKNTSSQKSAGGEKAPLTAKIFDFDFREDFDLD